MINLNDTTPAAPAGSFNVLWQVDASGNVSANVGLASTVTIVAPVAGVLTIDASLGNEFTINVNDNITATSITNGTDGQEITLLWKQDSSGHTIVLDPAMFGATAPSTGANTTSCQKFRYDNPTNNWYAVAAGVTGM